MTDLERILLGSEADVTEAVTVSDTEKIYYMGYAIRGTATTEATNAGTLPVWSILKVHEVSSTNGDGTAVKTYTRAWANGTENSQVVWANRAALTYDKFGR